MKHFAILACGFLAAGSLLADTWDKKTEITVNETILIPGKTLSPGKYVMKLANSQSNRNIVQIFNEDQTELQATILAFNNYRLQPTDKTVLTYWETPSGSPPALRAWFFPGDNYGQEFAYPKEEAERLARANNTTVASYEAKEPLSPQTAAQVEVDNAPALTERDAAVPAAQQAAQPANTANNTILAQNAPPPAQRDPVAQQDPAVTETPQPVTEDELPRTASPMPLVFVSALVLLGGAMGIRRIRRA